MKKAIFILVWVSLGFDSFAQKKDSIKTDSTKTINIITPPSSNNQAFPFLNVVPPSPEAAGLGRYGEIPVSLSTGTASFEVPIYELVSGSLKVPIKLTNHTAGVKVNDISSSVGSGWSLQAGGVITRAMKGGLWDDCASGYLNQVIPEQSDANNFYCFLGNLNTTKEYVDGMPDDFFYNINNLSGKFLYNSRTTANQNITPIPITYPHTALKIEWINQLNFRVTDTDGTVYKFEDLEKTFLAQTGRTNPCSPTYISAWYLTQIISPNKIDIITFTYTPPVRVNTSRIWSTTLAKEVNHFGSKTFTYSYANQQNDINSIMLSEINYKNGKVTFSYVNDRQDQGDADAKRLTRITIYQKDASGNTNELKHFSLNHSYFICADGRSQVDQPTSNVTGHTGSFLLKRLRLDSVVETAPDNSSLPPHTFDYYEDQPLAIYGALAQDYWGYSNNATANTNLLLWNTDFTRTEEPGPIYGANCRPNFDYAVSGALKRITYPTKGYGDFFYESNSINPASPIEGGGIRIKKIVNHDNNGSTIQTLYNYISSYFTNFVYTGTVSDITYYYTTGIRAEDPLGTNATCVSHFITVYPEKVNVSLGSESTFVANEDIEEYKEDGLGNRLGKKKYIYSTSTDQVFVEFPTETVSSSWKRGQLLNEKIYSILPSNSEVLIQEQQTIYTELTQPYKTRGYIARLDFDNDANTGRCQITGSRYCDKYSQYNLYIYAEKNEQSSVFLPTQTITDFYDENGQNPVQIVNLLEYNTINLQLTKTTTINSDGHIFESINRYPHDFNGNSVYDEMVNRHIFSPIVETEQKENSATLKLTKTNYKQWYASTNFGGELGFFAPLSVETQETGALETEIMMGEKLVNPTQDGYDLRARPVIFTDRATLTTQFEWWDDAGKKDLLKKKTASNQFINYDYEPAIGIKSMIDQNNLGRYFEYDNFKRLKLTKDQNFNIIDKYSYLYAPTITDKNAVTHSQLRIATTNEADANDPTKAVINTNYLDGLGRPLQTVGYRQSPNQNDIVSGAVTYDLYGRAFKTALATPTSTNSGVFQSNPISLAQSFYGDNRPFSAVELFDNSPLNREKEIMGIGIAWQNANKKSQIFYESAGNDVRKYQLDGSNNIVLNGSYPANSLFKKRTIDEQNHTSIEITDKRGRLIQKQQQDDNGFITTYYLYDGLNRAKAIIQPEGYELNTSINYNSTEWNNWVFFYQYDYRGRMSEKKVPNAGIEQMVYDKADRLVLEQSALQAPANKWAFMKYDLFSRAIIQGELTNNQSRTSLQNLFNNVTTPYEVWNGGYSNQSFPISNNGTDEKVWHFYDQYDWIAGEWAFNATIAYNPSSHLNSVIGLPTGSFARSNEDENKVFHTVMHYDNKSRILQTYQVHHKGGTSPWTKPIISNFEYNFVGEVTKEKVTYQTANEANKTKVKTYIYDHTGRKTAYNLNLENINERIANHEYDEIGRQKRNIFLPDGNFVVGGVKDYIKRPSPDGIVTQNNTQDIARKAIQLEPTTEIKAINLTSYLAQINPNAPQGIPITGLQKIDFSWHIRGGLVGINLDNAGNPVPKVSEGDLFSYKLDYETQGFFDGNIGKETWKSTLNTGTNRSYSYNYDAVSRLKSATYAGGMYANENYSLENVDYDKNGNMKTFWRKGMTAQNNSTPTAFGYVDKLNYQYNGNKLNGIKDDATNSLDVGDLQDNGNYDDYQYWNDGSLKSDANRAISLIEWDSFLKKPKQITYQNGRWIKHFYDGSSRKFKSVDSDGTIWEYIADMVYKNGILYQIQDDEGRILLEGNTYNYEFSYKDHLGNTRLSFKNSGGQLTLTQENTYYPFGLEQKGTDFYLGVNANNYQYNGKEKITSFGLNYSDYGFRTLDLQNNRFISIDPLAAKFPELTNYQYASNNPIRNIDLDGLEGVEAKKVRVYTETEGVGHTFVSIGQGKNTTVYSYGRYAGTDKNKSVGQSTSPTGPGVLVKLTGNEAKTYIKEILQERGGQAFDIKGADGNKVAGYFEKQLASSDEKPTKGLYSEEVQNKNPDITAKVVGQYDILSNNCTTNACNGVSQSIEGFGETGATNNSLFYNQPATQIIIPQSMQNYLNSSQNSQSVPYNNIKRELNIPNGWTGKY